MPPLAVVCPDVVHERLGDEIVVVQLGTNQIFALNETAALLWELVVAGRSRSEIEDDLTSRFAVAGPALAGEIDEIVGRLEAEGILERAAS